MTFPEGLSPVGPAGAPDGSDLAGLRSEALEVVLAALTWRLPAARWQAVEPALLAMEDAVTAGDAATLAAATAGLELAGPWRDSTRIGATPAGPPPQPVLLRLNRLIHSLGGTTLAQRLPDEDAGTAGDGACGR
jgi:CATRA-associated small protein